MTAAVLAEAAKLPAFVRRDVKVALSYRVAFASDMLRPRRPDRRSSRSSPSSIEPSKLPTFDGTQVTYLEFVATGMVINLALGVLLYRVAGAIRQEQLQGTLESLLATPTATATVQIGSVASTLLTVPLRATALLGAIALVFGLHFDPGGIVPAALIVAALMPFAGASASRPAPRS